MIRYHTGKFKWVQANHGEINKNRHAEEKTHLQNAFRSAVSPVAIPRSNNPTLNFSHRTLLLMYFQELVCILRIYLFGKGFWPIS